MKTYIILTLLFITTQLMAQKGVNGFVMEKEKHGKHFHEHPIPGVNIYWEGSTSSVQTNENGYFVISDPDSLPARLIFSSSVFPADTLLVEETPIQNLTLYLSANMLDDFEVKADKSSSYFDFASTRSSELLTEGELKKAPCCSVGESFETNATVDANFTDAVSGSKTIKMLGLDGVYSQIMFENIPLVRGLESRYGLNLIPGPWIESIQLTKGAGSVVNGYESTTGQINMEFHKPFREKLDPWYLNLFANHNGRIEGNAFAKKALNDKWSTLVLMHGSTMLNTNDHNNDGFYDMPRGPLLSFMNRWKYQGKARENDIGFGFSRMDKFGGQIDANSFAPERYRVDTKVEQYHGFFKNGFLFPKKDFTTVGVVLHGKYYKQESAFGNNFYEGEQKHFFGNLIWNDMFGTTAHTFKMGTSFMVDDYNESYNDSLFSRTELVPGIFYEHTYKYHNTFSLVVGGRADYHNLAGLLPTGRVHLRKQLGEEWVLRASAGNSYRMPNAISENISGLISNRELMVLEAPEIEKSFNFGGSLSWKTKFLKKEMDFRVDAFQTRFTNQWVVDREYSSAQVRMYNLDGESFSNVVQADVVYRPAKLIDMRISYKFTETRVQYETGLMDMPFVPKHRGLFNIGYETKSKRWRFDFTWNHYGKSRIPNTMSKPEEYRLEAFSDSYDMLSAQVTKVFRYFEVYAGAENLLNFIQPNAIIDAENPFGSEFDAGLTWGPLNGRVFYIGIRTRKLKK